MSRILYNLKAKIRNNYLVGRTMIQALLKELGKGGFIITLNAMILTDIGVDTQFCYLHSNPHTN